MFQELLSRFNIDPNKLNSDEIVTLDQWAKALAVQKLTIPEVLDFVSSMIVSVEKELAGYEVPVSMVAFLFRRSRRHSLEARLYNLLMLRDFLSEPDKAKKFVEKRLQALSESYRQ